MREEYIYLEYTNRYMYNDRSVRLMHWHFMCNQWKQQMTNIGINVYGYLVSVWGNNNYRGIKAEHFFGWYYNLHLVTDLLQRLWKQRILLTGRDRAPSVKSTDSKHYIVIPYNLFEHYMLIGQRYYIQKHDWAELVKFTCAMLDCCG